MRQLIVIGILGLLAAPSIGAVDSAETREAMALSHHALTADSDGSARLEVHRTTGALRLLTVPPGALALEGSTVEAKAQNFLARYGAAFGIQNADQNLVPIQRLEDRLGGQHLAYTQRHRGVPVFGGELRIHFDSSGEPVVINGTVVPDIQISSLVPNFGAEEAESIALAQIAKQKGDWSLQSSSLGLRVFRTGLVAGLSGSDHLVWEVEVGNGQDIREFVFVDAHRGFAVDQITGIKHIRRAIHHRRLANQLWAEGDPLPFEGLDEFRDLEVNGLIDFAEDTYQLFANLSGGTFLSYNGVDGLMRSIYEDENLNCPNAWWVGSHTGFCQSTASDDVVAHEWTHAYTDYTHDLIYQWQPGALNESYSDIFGEIVDQLNGVGTDSGGSLRAVATCSALTGGDQPLLVIQEPPEVAGEPPVSGAQFNPMPPWSVQGELELVNDGGDRPHDGCQELIDFTPGKVALLEFRTCMFRTPAENAAAAGASAVIVVNSINDAVVEMPGNGPRLDIPAVMVGKTVGGSLFDAVDQGVMVSIESTADGSVRWVLAEDTQWSGLRDMWHPECLGDPGKVSADRYWCSSDDGGGVHTNSGVPNHAFAFAVDGGTYNNRTVRGIGLTKAAHIYWRAMSVYQTRISDFIDHADLIDQSCRDLVGQPLSDLVTGATSGEVIETDDCVQVAEAMEAVEMRRTPSQCRFDTILDPDAPDQPRVRNELFSESFDVPPQGGWTVSNQGVEPEDWVPREWVWTDDGPIGGDGGAFFATNDPKGGNCFSNDQSGVLSLDTPPISIPDAGRLLLTFDHYVATEKRADGGNLRYSVNDGPWELVPSDDFLFNSYNMILEGPGTSNNPCAGEPAFSGVDETTYRGSWGQSQVNLTDRVRPGDTLRIRFNFGVDGCNGIDGWYVDNVRLLMGDSTVRGGGRVVP